MNQGIFSTIHVAGTYPPGTRADHRKEGTDAARQEGHFDEGHGKQPGKPDDAVSLVSRNSFDTAHERRESQSEENLHDLLDNTFKNSSGETVIDGKVAGKHPGDLDDTFSLVSRETFNTAREGKESGSEEVDHKPLDNTSENSSAETIKDRRDAPPKEYDSDETGASVQAEQETRTELPGGMSTEYGTVHPT